MTAPYKSVRFSRRRSSPVIIPPSFVATIFLRIVSAEDDASRSRCANASPAGSFEARSSSADRTAFMRSTANDMSPSIATNLLARVNCACRSAIVCVSRGSETSASGIV